MPKRPVPGRTGRFGKPVVNLNARSPGVQTARRQSEEACVRRWSADLLNVGGVETFVAVLDLELDLLSFGKRFEAVHRDSGEMHEDVFAALLFNEAVALGGIEPLHFPSGHARCLLRGETDPAPRCAGRAVGGSRAPI